MGVSFRSNAFLSDILCVESAEQLVADQSSELRQSLLLPTAAYWCFHADSQLVLRDPKTGASESRRIADTVPGDVVMVRIQWSP